MTPIARFQRLDRICKPLLAMAAVLAAMCIPFAMAQAGGLDNAHGRKASQAVTPAASTLRSKRQARRAVVQRGATLRATPRLPGEPATVAPARTPPPLTTERDSQNLDALKRLFRRPIATIPLASRDEVALGARLFANVQLSADHKLSCATCHDPARALADGRVRGRGNVGQSLSRNTPALWNVGWQKQFYWDGRSPTLEAQAKDAIEREGEMDATLEAAALWLSRDPSYAGVFETVYRISVLAEPILITRALAAYERSLVSPPTQFDRWIAGDVAALNDREANGFRLFTGKARCLACHGGWRFTDDDFHDIGLKSADRGRSNLPEASTAGRAFKTPSLREAAWTAPYMHDGSLATFDAVLDHYTRRLDRRLSLAPELRAPITLTILERADLIAFLRTLSSSSLPQVP